MADERRHALVIATSRYKDARLRQLAAPLNDAKAFAEVLHDPTLGDFAVTTVLDKDAAVVAEAIEGFCAERAIDDTIVVYFSGHGITDDGGNLFLAARNTVRERLRSTGVADSFLRDVLRTCRAQRQVLVLDCCFGGAISKAMLAKGAADQVNIEETFGGVGSGRVILTASNARQFAFEDEGEAGAPRRSVFTRTIVDGIRSGEADLDQDLQVSIDDLYKFAYRRLAIPGSNQTPTITNIGLEGTIVLARARARAASPASPAVTTVGAPRIRDLRAFCRIHDSGQEGSGAAIAVVTAMETQLAVQGRRQALSARYVYQKAKELTGADQGSDMGIDFEVLVRVVEEFGSVPEANWPYVPGKWARPKGRTMAALDGLARAYRARLSPVRSLAEIGAALDEGLPVLAAFTVYQSSWYSSAVEKGEAIQPPKRNETGVGVHLVAIVDLDRTAGVLRFANSWGDAWGDRGFGAMTIDAARVMLVQDQMWSVSVRPAPSSVPFQWTFDAATVAAPVTGPAEAPLGGRGAAPASEPAPTAMGKPAADGEVEVPTGSAGEARTQRPAPRPRRAATSRSSAGRPARADGLQRLVYDGRLLGAAYANLGDEALVRGEGDRATRDAAVDRVYAGIGAFHAFLADAFDRRSWDGRGGPYRAVVHYGEAYPNGFWDSGASVAVLGDGDGKLFTGFYSPDVVAKEFANGIVQAETPLAYAGQSGALMNALALILASMARQHAAREAAVDADWLIGTELFAPGVAARALFSLLDPGSAYDDPALGRDASVGHLDRFVTTDDDSGGVHVNSGIPTRAFALAARALGGRSWERAGRAWYRTMTSGTLEPKTTFAAFAAATLAVARRDFDDEVGRAIADGWREVGIPLPPEPTNGPARAASRG